MRMMRMMIYVLFIGAIAILAFGCNEEATPSVKKSRLIATENKNLLKQIEERDNQIEKLKRQHEQELAKQKEMLTKCQQERDMLKEKVGGQIETQVQSVLQGVMDQNKQLRDKVAELEAQLKELQNK